MASRLAITSILGATVFLIGTSASAISPYRGIVAVDYLRMTASAYALVTSISSLGTAVVSLLLGHYADRMHDRRVGVLVCAVFAGSAYALIFLVPSQLNYIIAFCVILPLGGALFSQTFSCSRVYYDRTQPARAEFMMSALRTLFSLAWVVAPAWVGWVASRYSVFGVFGAAAGAQIVLIVVFSSLFLTPETKVGNDWGQSGSAVASEGVPIGRCVGIVGVSLLRVAIFLHLMTAPLVLTNNFHGSLADVSLNVAVCAGLEIPFMLAWGYAAGRFSKEPIIVLSALVYALYLGLIYFARSVQDVLWLQVLNAIGTGALVSIPISYMQESIKGRVGLSTALFDMVTVLAQMVASAVFAIFSAQGNYIPVLLAAAVISLLGAGAVGVSKAVKIA